MKRHIVLVLMPSFLLAFNAKAQLPNDDCAGAQNLGSLGVPAACPNGTGAVSTFNLTNVNAVEEFTWSSLSTCQPGGASTLTPNADVWYSFVNQGLTLTLTINGNIQNPCVVLYNDACNTIRDCAVGSGGSVTLIENQMNVGQTYYLQIFGGSAADQGNFTLNLQNSNGCDECLTASNLTVNPAPVNGRYQAGQTVTFCYSITQWNLINTNWLHGVVPTFGNGWDLTTLTTVAPPDCDGSGGVWSWYNNINTTLPTNGGYGVMSGFFFDGNPGPDGDPIANYGDRCGTPEANDPLGPAPPPNWVFCWTVTAKDCPPGQNNDDLGIVINTFGDGQTGNWDDLGCNNDPSYTFTAALICCTPPLMAQVNNACYNGTTGTATATGQGVGPYNYVWTNTNNVTIQTANGVAGPNTVSGLAAGTYTVTVTDTDNGCVQTATVTITQPTQLQTVIASTAETCGQGNGTATVTPQGGTGPYDFEWTNVVGTVIQTDNNLPGASSATGLAGGTYGIEVTDANGCVVNVSTVVQAQAGNLASATNSTNATCNGVCNGSGTVTLNGGTSPYDFVWKDANNITVHTDNNIAGPSTAPNLCAGTYTINYNDNNNCSGTTTITITEPTAVTVAVNPAAICYGANTNLTANAAGGTGNGYSYTWLPAGTGNTQIVNVSPTQTTQYTVTVTDANNCASQPANVTVTVSPQLTVTLTAQPPAVCEGNSTTLTAVAGGGNGGPYNYIWLPAGTAGNTNSAVVTPLATTQYTVTVSDGCTNPDATDDVTVNVNPLPVVTFVADPLTGCEPFSTTLTNTCATSVDCIWDFGNGTISQNCGPNVPITYPDAGCYDITLTVTDVNGCTGTLTQPQYLCALEVTNALFSANPQPADIFDAEIEFTDESEGGANQWAWDFGGLGTSTEQDPSFRFPGVGCYDVVLIANNANDCPDSDTVRVCINPIYTIYFPNSFTPNNDGKNEGFMAKGEGIKEFSMWIFNRWGEMIYFTNDMARAWDGRKKGNDDICLQDVYVWKARVVDIFNKEHEYLGRVTLLK